MIVRLTKVALFGATMLGASLPVLAVSTPAFAETVYTIPQTDLGRALLQLGREAGRNITFSPDLVRGRRSTAVTAAKTFEAALGELLAGSGLAFRIEQDGSVTISAPPKPERHAEVQHGLSNVPSDDAPITTQEITVIGYGQSRQINQVSQNIEQILPPGTSPYQMINFLPGVKFSNVNPLGVDELSFDLSVRGFTQTRLGFTMDDVPLGDQSYGNYDGLGIGRAIAPENVSSTTLAEGIGSLGTASTSNLGGTIEVQSKDPSQTPGVSASASRGDYQSTREYVRLDTGELNGFSSYVSAIDYHTMKWKGNGNQDEQQLNAKARYNVGNFTLTAYLDAANLNADNYLIMTPSALSRLGYNYDQFAPNFAHALATAKGNYYGGIESFSDSQYDSLTLRDDLLSYVSAEYKATPDLTLSIKSYYHYDQGQGNSYTNSPGSSAAVPLSVRSTYYYVHQDGFIEKLNWRIGVNDIEIGGWHETDDFRIGRNWYDITGPIDIGAYLSDPSGTYFKFDQALITDVYHIQDRITLLDARLHLDLGAKSFTSSQHMTSFVGNYGSGSITANRNFLPQFGINYSFWPRTELYAAWSDNITAIPSSTNSPFFQTPSAAGISTSVIKPEESRTTEVGVRTSARQYQLALSAYSVDFLNRITSIGVCPFQATCATVLANAGSVYSKGVEITANFYPTKSISFSNNLSLNKTTYLNNFTSNGTTIVDVAGKVNVDVPEVVASSVLKYSHKNWLVSVDAQYVGKRYVTYTNDDSIGAYTLVGLHGGYKFGDYYGFKNVELSVDGTNIFNERYVSSLYATAISDPTHTLDAYLIGAPATFTATISARY